MQEKKHIATSGLLHEYVLGLTSDEENKEVELLLQNDPALRREVTVLKQNLLHYAKKHTPYPSSSTGTSARSRTPRARSVAKYTSLAAFAFAASILVLFYTTWNRQSAQLATLRQELASCKKSQDANQAVAQLFNQITTAGAVPVTLRGTLLAPESVSVVYWNQQKEQAFVNAAGLPAPPSGHQYQIWADVDGQMIDLGLIQPEQKSLQPIQYVQRAASLNITIEPLGGSEHPTVSKLLANGII